MSFDGRLVEPRVLAVNWERVGRGVLAVPLHSGFSWVVSGFVFLVDSSFGNEGLAEDFFAKGDGTSADLRFVFAAADARLGVGERLA